MVHIQRKAKPGVDSLFSNGLQMIDVSQRVAAPSITALPCYDSLPALAMTEALVCVFFTLRRSFYLSTSSTTSVRAVFLSWRDMYIIAMPLLAHAMLPKICALILNTI